MIASLPAYVFTQGGADTAAAVPAPRVCLQLPISCVAHLDVEDQQVVLTVDSDLPWRGCYEILVEPSDPLLLALILPAPAWFEQLSVQVNGARVLPDVGDGYFTVTQLWQSGDRVRVDSQMPVRVVEAHPLVAANVDRVAVTRGPLVYCVEQVDNDAPVSTLHVPPSATWRAAKRKVGALEVEVLQTEAASLVPSDSRLYRAACTGGATTATPRSTMVQAVPYFAWANRADGAMQVWMRREQRHPGRSADEAARARAHQ